MRIFPFARCTIATLIALFIVITPSKAQNEKLKGLERLQSHVTELALSFPGTIGVYARNIETGAEVSYKSDDKFPMASVYKIAIMVQVFREVDAGRLNLTDRIDLTEADRRLGSGLFIEGLFARFVYDSLRLMHERALNGTVHAVIGMLSRTLSRQTGPAVKLH